MCGKWGAHLRKEWVLNYEQVWKFTRVHSTHPLHHLKRSSTLNRAHWRSYTTWGCKSIAAAAIFSSMCISWAQGTGGPEARSHWYNNSVSCSSNKTLFLDKVKCLATDYSLGYCCCCCCFFFSFPFLGWSSCRMHTNQCCSSLGMYFNL